MGPLRRGETPHVGGWHVRLHIPGFISAARIGQSKNSLPFPVCSLKDSQKFKSAAQFRNQITEYSVDSTWHFELQSVPNVKCSNLDASCSPPVTLPSLTDLRARQAAGSGSFGVPNTESAGRPFLRLR